ncbi:MAG TPA: SDR family NAD(P)-dependent oxidoreductase [Flavisolibacter sp.]
MPYALVAGGSKGIGLAISVALAKRKYDLVIVARDAGRLAESKQQLEQQYGIQVITLSKDLSLRDSAAEVVAFCRDRNIFPAAFCHVAGIGGTDDYLTASLEEMRYMVHLNVEAVMALTQLMLPLLRKHSRAHIMIVGSMAGLAPIPVKNLYSATKSAVLFFCRSLRSQLKHENISVTCLCPGPVFTKPEITRYTLEKLGAFGKLIALQPGAVGEAAVDGMLRKETLVIPGFVAKVTSVFLRFLPQRLLIFIYSRMDRG